MEQSPRRCAHTKVGPRRVGVLTKPCKRPRPAARRPQTGLSRFSFSFSRKRNPQCSRFVRLCSRRFWYIINWYNSVLEKGKEPLCSINRYLPTWCAPWCCSPPFPSTNAPMPGPAINWVIPPPKIWGASPSIPCRTSILSARCSCSLPGSAGPSPSR